jgi:3'-phosphoadenosine 5'-phosphosulfate synthase
VYDHRKEEIVSRCFGAIDRGHPYMAHIYASGDYLIGGEVTLLGKVKLSRPLDCATAARLTVVF